MRRGCLPQLSAGGLELASAVVAAEVGHFGSWIAGLQGRNDRREEGAQQQLGPMLSPTAHVLDDCPLSRRNAGQVREAESPRAGA
eukprot:5525825-Pyramimonas_sp.AAC.1